MSCEGNKKGHKNTGSLLVFYYGDKILKTNNLKDEVFAPVHGFKVFQSMVSLFHCWGQCGQEEQHGCKGLWWSKIANLMVVRKQRKKMPVHLCKRVFSLLPLYSIQTPSLLGSDAQIQDGSPTLVNPVWKCSQPYTEVCVTILPGASQSNQVDNQD
jgi:hypothetical protein